MFLDYWPFVTQSRGPIIFYISECSPENTTFSGPVTFGGTNTTGCDNEK